MQLRRGREYYGSRYDEAVRLFGEGEKIKDIACKLGISYSTAYHWLKGIRRPESGNVNEFAGYIRQNGPCAALHIMDKFRKHNELFLIASRRGIPVKRIYLGKKYRELATWYYLEGQEDALNERIEETRKKIDQLKSRLMQIKRTAYN
jgi:hypothetical protein